MAIACLAERAVLALADMVHFFAHERAGLRRCTAVFSFGSLGAGGSVFLA